MSTEEIRSAIESKLIIEFHYHGHHRIAEPHVLGTKGGRNGVLIYQLGGTSSSGDVPSWRRCFLDEISSLTVTEEHFDGRRPNPTGQHSAWDYTIAIVDR